MPTAVSLAEQYRAHREAFELALRLGCTPKEAERKLRAERRTRRRVCGTAAPIGAEQDDTISMDQPPANFAAWSAPWMMRD